MNNEEITIVDSVNAKDLLDEKCSMVGILEIIKHDLTDGSKTTSTHKNTILQSMKKLIIDNIYGSNTDKLVLGFKIGIGGSNESNVVNKEVLGSKVPQATDSGLAKPIAIRLHDSSEQSDVSTKTFVIDDERSRYCNYSPISSSGGMGKIDFKLFDSRDVVYENGHAIISHRLHISEYDGVVLKNGNNQITHFNELALVGGTMDQSLDVNGFAQVTSPVDLTRVTFSDRPLDGNSTYTFNYKIYI